MTHLLKKLLPIERNRGFTLLIAIILSALALSIGTALASLAYKQLLLSSASADSGPAFYAADSGLECALYWDQQQDAFNYSHPLANIACGGTSLPLSAPVYSAATSTITFHWAMDSNTRCSDVTVAKGSTGHTAIYAVGHNTCDTTSSRLIERGIKTVF